MKCNPSADSYSQAAQLAVAHPDPPVERIAGGVNAEFGRSSDHDFFQPFHIGGDRQPGGAQVNDRVSDQLTRTVKCDVAAAFHVHYRDLCFLENSFRDPDICQSAPAAESEDRRMFREKENICRDRPGAYCSNQTQLKVMGLFVTHQPQVGAEPCRSLVGFWFVISDFQFLISTSKSSRWVALRSTHPTH